METNSTRRTIAAAAQRYVNTRVFRDLAAIIEEWKAEEASRHRAARLLLLLIALGAFAGAVTTFIAAATR